MIPTSIDGTDITGATIDGTDVTEITVDGQTVFTAAVEVNGLFIDDFADGKLTNRDEFSTTPLNPSSLEPGTSNTTVTTRPEYVVSKAFVNSSNELESNAVTNQYVLAPLPSFTGTHNITTTRQFISGGQVTYILLSVGTNVIGNDPNPENGYIFQMNGSGSFAGIRKRTNGSLTNLATNQDAKASLIEASFDDSGNFTLETQSGTLSATDTTHNFDHIGIGWSAGAVQRHASFVVD